jgi:hypothetical protein
MSKEKRTSSYSLPVRVLTIILIAAVTSGMLIYLVTLLMNMLG